MPVSQLSAESTELVELRELREDVERRERAQAAVIENQAKRLDELETLYKVHPPADMHQVTGLCLDLQHENVYAVGCTMTGLYVQY